MLPVTGPTYESISVPFGNFSRDRYRQKMPVDRPLPVRSEYAFGRNRAVDNWYDLDPPYATGSYDSGFVKQANFVPSADAEFPRRRAAAFNQAYERLRGQVSDQAGWAENFAQIDKTRKAIVDRCSQLASFTVALRRCDFRRAARALRTPVPSGVSNRKAVSQNFLEFEYGWKPLFSDIKSSFEVLASDPGRRLVKGSARDHVNRVTITSATAPGYQARQVATVTYDIMVRCQTFIRVTNPNLFLANQLGVLDPALPWKLIPFSFVVDWFVNVEQVISSVSDWYGVTLEDPHVTSFYKGFSNSDFVSERVTSSRVTHSKTWLEQDGVQLFRTLGIPAPTLAIKPFKGFSLERGAQAIALVLSVLGR